MLTIFKQPRFDVFILILPVMALCGCASKQKRIPAGPLAVMANNRPIMERGSALRDETAPSSRLPVASSVVLKTISRNDVPNFHSVKPYLLRGAAPDPQGLKKLAEAGVRTIIDLRIAPRKVTAERREVQALGMRFINLPMSGDPPTQKEIDTFLATVRDPASLPVFVHCQHGADRTGTMVGIFREQDEGWGFEPTYREMRRYGFNPHWRKLTATVRRYAPGKPVPSTQSNSGSPHKDYVAVLVWHDIVSRKQVWFDTTVLTFRKQLEAIRRGNFHVVSLEALYRHLTQNAPLPPRALVLTFDDNNQGIYDNAYPLLRQYGYPVTLFVHTNYVGVTTDKSHCSWDELRTMQTSGLVNIQSLTASHPEDILQLTDPQVEKELRASRRSIEAHLGPPVWAFVYPCNRHDARVANDVYRGGYKLAFTEDWGNACASPNLMLIHRYAAIKRFAQALSDVARPQKGKP